MLNAALLTSVKLVFPTLLILTKTCVLTVFGTVQLKVPVFGAEELMIFQLEPLSVEYSIKTEE